MLSKLNDYTLQNLMQEKNAIIVASVGTFSTGINIVNIETIHIDKKTLGVAQPI